MKPTPYDKYWAAKANWKWRCFYCCKDDPRVIVPKRPAWAGRTLNFAHRKSYECLFWTLTIPLSFIFLVDKMNMKLLTILYLGVMTGIVIFYYAVDLRAE